MPTINQITLQNPGQFNPGNTIKLTVRYPNKYRSQYVTIVVSGYKITYDNVDYTGGKFTAYANESLNGEGIVEVTIPSGSLAPNLSSVDPDNYFILGHATAYAVFGELGDDGHVEENENSPRSNSIMLNMSMISDADFTFEYKQPDGSYLANGSSLVIWMHLVERTSAGESNANNLKSYRIFLYDSNEEIIFDSGMKKDWLFPTYHNHSYRIKHLQDNTIYYISAQAVTSGGTTLTIPKTIVNVDYESLPTVSERITLTPTVNGIKVLADLSDINHTKVIINREAFAEGMSLNIKEIDHIENQFIFTDHYSIPKKTYIYNVVVYNGNNLIGTFSNYITYESNYVVISDAFGSYAAIGDVKKYPISRNDRGSEIEVMDNQYPYYLINGDANFERGTVDGIFGELEDCQLQTDNAIYSKQLRAWLNNGQPKLLCYYNGESWIVAVSGVQTTDPNDTDTLNTSFNWVQLGEGEDTSLYTEMGLLRNG